MTTNMINKDENKHNIWFTSDLHFNHDKEFVWKERGFNSVQEMNDKILENLNACISPDDDLYILGDLFLGGKADIEILKSIPGHIHIIAGNHDTPTKIKVYEEVIGEQVKYADVLDYKGEDGFKRHFYLSHYPTDTGNTDSNPNNIVVNLYGHTHQNRYENPLMFNAYNVGMDAHHCFPVTIDSIIEDLKIRRRFANRHGIVMILNQPDLMDGEIKLRHFFFIEGGEKDFKQIKEDYYKEYEKTDGDIFIPVSDLIEGEYIAKKLNERTGKFDLREML